MTACVSVCLVNTDGEDVADAEDAEDAAEVEEAGDTLRDLRVCLRLFLRPYGRCSAVDAGES